MIRPLTCICMLMAAGAGLYLYQTKHRAQLLDREIAHTYDQIEQTKKRIGVLKGEWAVMNEPERLAELARQHLTLRSLTPTQFVALADIGNRLPAPLPPGTLIVPPDEAPAPTPVQNTPANTPIATGKPAPVPTIPKTPAAQPQLASFPQPPAYPPARPAPRPTAILPTSLPSPSLPPPVPRLTAPIVNVSAPPVSTVHAAPPPVPQIVPATMASPVAPAPATRYAATTTANQSFNNAPPFGSALGGAGHVALPAPVPYGAAAR